MAEHRFAAGIYVPQATTAFSIDMGSLGDPISMENAVDSTVDACPYRRTGFHFAGTCSRFVVFFPRPLRWLCTSVAVLAWFFAPALAKDEFKYDPAACTSDAHGHLYIALGPNVFVVPFSKNGVYVLNSLLPKERRPAPEPTEPEGCPGNPSQQGSFGFYFGSPLVDAGSGGLQQEAPTRLTLYSVRYPDSKADADHSEWFGESTIALLAKSTCERATLREVLPNGLTACRVKQVREVRIEDWAVSLISDPANYATPRGRPFMVHCDPDLYSGPSITNCKVGYSIAPGLAVGYEFQPYRGKSAVPFDHIIMLDRNIRAQVDKAMVKDYIWPNQEDDNGAPKTGRP